MVKTKNQEYVGTYGVQVTAAASAGEVVETKVTNRGNKNNKSHMAWCTCTSKGGITHIVALYYYTERKTLNTLYTTSCRRSYNNNVIVLLTVRPNNGYFDDSYGSGHLPERPNIMVPNKSNVFRTRARISFYIAQTMS